jgi:hypothetical protein
VSVFVLLFFRFDDSIKHLCGGSGSCDRIGLLSRRRSCCCCFSTCCFWNWIRFNYYVIRRGGMHPTEFSLEFINLIHVLITMPLENLWKPCSGFLGTFLSESAPFGILFYRKTRTASSGLPCYFISVQDLTVLPIEFFCRHKTHIPSIINLLTKLPT